MNEVTKAVVAKYNASELLTKREVRALSPSFQGEFLLLRLGFFSARMSGYLVTRDICVWRPAKVGVLARLLTCDVKRRSGLFVRS